MFSQHLDPAVPEAPNFSLRRSGTGKTETARPPSRSPYCPLNVRSQQAGQTVGHQFPLTPTYSSYTHTILGSILKKKKLVLLSNLVVGSSVFPLFLYHKGPIWSPCKQSALEKYLLIHDVHLVNFPQGRYSEILFENSYIRFYH